MNIRVLAVDDEPLALERLTLLLEEIEGVELAGTASNGRDAIDAVASLRPDLVLLDVEMPQMDGFDVVERMSGREFDQAPLVAFATAYPQFALQAFDSGALDFLCKPIRLQRLQKTIERARSALEQRAGSKRLAELSRNLDELRAIRAPVERDFWLQHRGEAVRLVPREVDWIEAEGQYVRLHIGSRSYLLRHSLSSFVRDFSTEGFVQIHRSAAVNRHKLARIKASRDRTKVELVSGLELPVGRIYKRQVRSLLAE
jgi:DNA-binding LytR/AlgR family response regulator